MPSASDLPAPMVNFAERVSTFVNSLDWELAKTRSKRDLRAIGTCLAILGESMHDAGTLLADSCAPDKDQEADS